jgi:hypothetical protein
VSKTPPLDFGQLIDLSRCSSARSGTRAPVRTSVDGGHDGSDCQRTGMVESRGPDKVAAVDDLTTGRDYCDGSSLQLFGWLRTGKRRTRR